MKAPSIHSISLAAVLTCSQLSFASPQIDSSFHALLTGGSVNAILPNADGTVLIGGEFLQNAAGTFGLAKLQANGQLDGSFQVASNLQVNALASGNLVGGRFSAVGGAPANNFARLLDSGVLDNSFETGSGPSGSVDCLATDSQGRTVLGGNFRAINGSPSVYVARLNASGSPDSSFACALKPSFAIEAGAMALAVQADGKILVGGNFETEQGFEYLVRLNQNGSLDTTFNGNHGPMLYPNAIVPLANGQIVVAGQMNNGKSFVRRLNADRSVDTSFSAPEFAGFVEALALLKGKIVVGGSFGVVRLHDDGSQDAGWTPAVSGYVRALAVDSSGRLFAGGTFNQRLVRIVDEKLNSYATNGNGFRGTLNVEASGDYTIEVSSDLVNWSEFGRGTASGTRLQVQDTEATASTKRFFRARLVQ